MWIVFVDVLNFAPDLVELEKLFGIFDVADNFLKEFFARFGQREYETIAFRFGQICGLNVPNKAQLFDRGIYLIDGLLFDAFATIQDTIDGRAADAGRFCQIFCRWSHH